MARPICGACPCFCWCETLPYVALRAWTSRSVGWSVWMSTFLVEVRCFTLRATNFLLLRLTICALRKTKLATYRARGGALAAWLVAQQPASFKSERHGAAPRGFGN